MRDAIENLSKLPEMCVAVMEGAVVAIRRGAVRPTAYPFPSTVVDSHNHSLGVTPQQVQAMIVGVTMGWDADGADPDTHAEPLDRAEEVGPFRYTYAADLAFEVKVEAHTEEQAAQKARRVLDELSIWISASSPFDEVTGGESSDTMDLIETNDPR